MEHNISEQLALRDSLFVGWLEDQDSIPTNHRNTVRQRINKLQGQYYEDAWRIFNRLTQTATTGSSETYQQKMSRTKQQAVKPTARHLGPHKKRKRE